MTPPCYVPSGSFKDLVANYKSEPRSYASACAPSLCPSRLFDLSTFDLPGALCPGPVAGADGDGLESGEGGAAVAGGGAVSVAAGERGIAKKPHTLHIGLALLGVAAFAVALLCQRSGVAAGRAFSARESAAWGRRHAAWAAEREAQRGNATAAASATGTASRRLVFPDENLLGRDCDPAGAFQPHALWHYMTALALCAGYLYFRTEDRGDLPSGGR